jgi:hypothetical protein
LVATVKLATKPSASFVGIISDNRLRTVANFLNEVAAASMGKASATTLCDIPIAI